MACDKGGSCVWVVRNDANGKAIGMKCTKCGTEM